MVEALRTHERREETTPMQCQSNARSASCFVAAGEPEGLPKERYAPLLLLLLGSHAYQEGSDRAVVDDWPLLTSNALGPLLSQSREGRSRTVLVNLSIN